MARILKNAIRKKSGIIITGIIMDKKDIEIIQLISDGRSINDIGSEIHLSGRTVENRIRSLYDCTGYICHAQLTKWALKNGIIS